MTLGISIVSPAVTTGCRVRETKEPFNVCRNNQFVCPRKYKRVEQEFEGKRHVKGRFM